MLVSEGAPFDQRPDGDIDGIGTSRLRPRKDGFALQGGSLRAEQRSGKTKKKTSHDQQASAPLSLCATVCQNIPQKRVR
eukprot:5095886-Pyramimonas_sp.AAC.1